MENVIIYLHLNTTIIHECISNDINSLTKYHTTLSSASSSASSIVTITTKIIIINKNNNNKTDFIIKTLPNASIKVKTCYKTIQKNRSIRNPFSTTFSARVFHAFYSLLSMTKLTHL